MTRLTYTENAEKNLVSKPVIGNGNTLVVTLDPTNLMYKITNQGGEHTFGYNKAKNLTSLKLAARKALVALGVVFVAEVRNRTQNMA